ncbi:dihydrolipoyl dehydrogenase [Caloramator quimbayensis]|uniref:dihydrolipoyl dehydrogenase n=1 Tax=Caloramator quimbayensis TaxID=1147123 RepID=UPI001FA8DD8E|nr:dihydrolipoyl dehydrogenase [Caloramator quimbayensis]
MIWLEIRIGNILPHGSEAVITKIYKNEGDYIGADEIFLEAEGNKTNISFKTNVDGKIEKIFVSEGSNINSDTILAVIAEDNKSISSMESTTFDYFSNFFTQVTKKEYECDIAIVGAGPGGYVSAIYAAKRGAKVVLIEKDSLGGTCLNKGCIPTKALIRSANVYNTIKKAEKYGCYCNDFGIDMNKIIERKNNIVNQLVDGIKYLLNKNNVETIYGEGKIFDTNKIIVKSNNTEITVNTKNIIIATGSKSSVPNIQGINNKNIIYSDEALNLTNLPKKLAIIGGGVIGMEFAHMLSSFGVEVYIIEYFDKCLSSLDDDLIEEIEKHTKEKNIKIYTSSLVKEFIESEDGNIIVRFEQNSKEHYLACDKVLLSTGRAPYLPDISNEGINLEINEKGRGIKVNSKMQTNIPNIYAIGDVTGKSLLAHVASHQGIVAVENILGTDKEINYDDIPSAIFTDPEIAIVGITEKEAINRGIKYKVSKIPYSAIGKALCYGDIRGFAKLIEDVDTNRIIGAAIIGLGATDLLGELSLSVSMKVKAEDLIETIHAHPTTPEIIHEAALGLNLGAIHF